MVISMKTPPSMASPTPAKGTGTCAIFHYCRPAEAYRPMTDSSPFSHTNESAHPGYYQVYLERYAVNAELTSTLRCAFHKYTFKDGESKRLIADLSMSNEESEVGKFNRKGTCIQGLSANQRERWYFYATSNLRITGIESLKDGSKEISVVNFADSPHPLEWQIGFSFVSTTTRR